MYNLNKKLEALRVEWATASPAMKQWILSGAKLLKEELARLEKKEVETEKLI